MTVTLYQNDSDRKKLNKSLTNLATVNAILKSDVNSVVDIEIEVGSYNSNCNYVYVSTFSRYYFVEDIKPLTGHRVLLTCHVDVLMSYKGGISNSTCIIKRSTSNGNNLIVDENAVLQKDKTYDTIMVGKFLAPIDYVLAVCG